MITGARGVAAKACPGRRKRRVRQSLALLILAWATGVFASDACRRAPLAAAAEVAVSDGTAFEAETWFAAAGDAAIAQVRDGVRSVNAVEGPFAWASENGEMRGGNDFTRLFALGHQFHAWWLYFDGLVAGAARETSATFGGETRAAREGAFPYGGSVALVPGDDPERPQGLRFAFPGDLVVEATFADWRTGDGRPLPWRVDIDDGERVFTYRYRVLAFGADAEAWWAGRPHAAWAAPEVEVHRLHRALLAAHCDGDAARMAALAAPEGRYLGQGAFDLLTPDDIRARFRGVFDRLDYHAYEDVEPPVIDVAASGDLAWATVEVRARGSVRASGEAFDDQWAWVMLARRVDGAWRNAGIAASRR